jgi:hypothetical protein
VADLSDVLDAVAGLAAMAVYPNGTGFASITGKQVTVGDGWPKPADLDAAFARNPPISIVTIFSPPMSTALSTQVYENPQVVVPAVFGLGAPVIGPTWSPWTVTLSGTPVAGEYVTAVIDRTSSFTYTVLVGDTLNAVATNLAALIAATYPGTSATGPVITIPGSTISLHVRQGAKVTMGNLLHRQKQNIRVSVWAPNPTDRTTIGKAIDVVLKQNLRITFPDTSQGIMTYESTMLDDNSQNMGEYRRDIVMGVEYGTMETYAAYIITSATMTLAALQVGGDNFTEPTGTSNVSVN